MAKSLIGKIRAAALASGQGNPIPHASRWNSNNLFGSGLQDRFTQLQAMSGQGTLFGIIQLLSTGSQTSGEWNLYRKKRDGRVRYTTSDRGSDQRTEVLQHWALKLWNQPNNFMTGVEFREIGWQFMELVGEWFWVMDRGPSGKGIPIEMWPVRPDRMEPVPDKKKFLAGWVYTGPNGEQVPLLHDEVIQLKYPNPSDIYRGLSGVQAVLADIDAAKYTAEWSRNFFLNSATPGGIVQFSKRLTDDEFTEFADRWREQHQGVSRGHRVGVLEQGAIWVPNTMTMKDMQFLELRKDSANNIREAYRIHPSMMGTVEDVNRANAQTAEQVHVRWHEIPRLKRIRNTLNGRFLEMFGATGKDVEFDFPDPSPASAQDANEELTAKTKAVTMLVAAGFDPEEACEVVGLPNMTWRPLVSGPAGGPPAQSAPEEDEPDVSASQYEDVEGNLAGDHGIADWADFDVAGFAETMRNMFADHAVNGNGHRKKELTSA